MADNPLAQFNQATAVAEKAIAAVRPDQLDDPTPCTQWSVRQLINHLVTGNLTFVSMVAGTPPPDRSKDHLGEDPTGAFRETVGRLRTAFAADGALDRTYPTPFGPGPGTRIVTMRVIEMMTHSWDLAKATGQPTDLDPELAEYSLASFRAAGPIPRGGSSPFAAEQPLPAGASAADRLAAFLGRAG